MDFNTVAKQFTEYYYATFDNNRGDLGPLYRETSMLTFETNQVMGVGPIIEKLVSFPFQKVRHQIDTLDAQPSGPNGSILVLVTGGLLVDEEQNPMRFSQAFNLVPEGGSYYVLNDVFRLIYG